MRFVSKILILLSLLLVVLTACTEQPENESIMLATTTSTEDSGLLDYLLPQFEADTGIEVRVIAVGTGKALKMGEQGDVDLVLVHAKLAEQAFVSAGFGLERVKIMYNDFVLVGPNDDPAGLQKLTTINAAMNAIKDTHVMFISRGDNSGTHNKELLLWQAAGAMPDEKTYRETGQGMGKTLQIASEISAYTLVDRGTWISHREGLELDIIHEGSPPLNNQYSAILVNPGRYSDLNTEGAREFIEWMTSEQGQALIGQYALQGEVLFKPNAAE